MKKILLTLAFLLITSSAWAYTETFYVCNGGDGSLPETATCATAWDEADFNTSGNWAATDTDDGKIGPNDVVYLLDDGGAFDTTLTTKNSGLSGKPITIMPAPGDTVTLTPSSGKAIAVDSAYITIDCDYRMTINVADNANYIHGIHSYLGDSATDYTTVNGCTIVGPGSGATYQWHGGIVLKDDNFTLTNNTIYYTNVGIQIVTKTTDTGVHNGTISGNIVHDTTNLPANEGDGIGVYSTTTASGDWTGLTISNNWVYNFADDGIDQYGAIGPTIEYNEVGPATITATETNVSAIKGGGGFSGAGYGIIRYNTLHDINLTGATNNIGINTNQGVGHEIYGNLIYGVDRGIVLDGTGNGGDWLVYNNTIEASALGIYAYEADGTDTYIRNNIISGTSIDISLGSTTNSEQFYGGYNILWGGTPVGEYLNNYDEGAGDLEDVDPLLTADYRLTASSPAIGAGLTLSSTYKVLDPSSAWPDSVTPVENVSPSEIGAFLWSEPVTTSWLPIINPYMRGYVDGSTALETRLRIQADCSSDTKIGAECVDTDTGDKWIGDGSAAVQQLNTTHIATTISDPGSDSSVPSEQAVREEFDSLSGTPTFTGNTLTLGDNANTDKKFALDNGDNDPFILYDADYGITRTGAWGYSNDGTNTTIIDNYWSGNTIYWLGTSIPRNGHSTGDSYPERVGELIGATVTNKAGGGTHMVWDATSDITCANIRDARSLSSTLEELEIRMSAASDGSAYCASDRGECTSGCDPGTGELTEADIQNWSFEDKVLGNNPDVVVLDHGHNDYDKTLGALEPTWANISGITNATSGVITTSAAHGLSTGDAITLKILDDEGDGQVGDGDEDSNGIVELNYLTLPILASCAGVTTLCATASGSTITTNVNTSGMGTFDSDDTNQYAILDRTNYYAAMHFVIRAMYFENSDMDLILMNPPNYFTYQSETWRDYIDRMRFANASIAKYYGVPIYDMTSAFGINNFNLETYMTDWIHPNTAAAQQKIASGVATWMVSGINGNNMVPNYQVLDEIGTPATGDWLQIYDSSLGDYRKIDWDTISSTGGADIITEGNSNVEVIDAGTGEIQIDIDGKNIFQVEDLTYGGTNVHTALHTASDIDRLSIGAFDGTTTVPKIQFIGDNDTFAGIRGGIFLDYGSADKTQATMGATSVVGIRFYDGSSSREMLKAIQGDAVSLAVSNSEPADSTVNTSNQKVTFYTADSDTDICFKWANNALSTTYTYCLSSD